MLSGSVQIAVLGFAPVLQHLESGAFKALAIASAARRPELPNVPTMPEVGYPDLVVDVTFAMFAPARTPSEIVQRLARDAEAAMKRNDVQQKFKTGGFDVTAVGPEELRKKTAREVQFWKEVVALTGIRIK
jgi:tripartite-type tricarboxylate transporter receptor subunit TctC